MYTHTAEGQIFAVEQETGRLLWRRYWPDVYLSFTSPLYYNEKLLVPQAGMKQSRLRCLDAATGELLWEAPFTGSPSWSRQVPPVVHGNLAIYVFGSGRYAPQGTEKAYVQQDEPEPRPDGAEVMSWIYTHDNPYYPKDNRPLHRAPGTWTPGELVWQRDFSEFGTGGNDCGLCLMDGTLYYSTFFGYAAQRRGEPGPRGLTAALDPATGKVLWLTTEYYVTAGCTISGADGRLYLGGYNQPQRRRPRTATSGASTPGTARSSGSPSPSPRRSTWSPWAASTLFSNASGKDGHVFDSRRARSSRDSTSATPARGSRFRSRTCSGRTWT